MVKSFSWKIHLLAGLFCLLVLCISFFAGILIENSRISDFENKLYSQDKLLKEFEIYSYSEDLFNLSFDPCPVANSIFDELNIDLVNSLRLVESFGNNIQTGKFREAYSSYTLDNLRYWSVFEKFDGECVLDKETVLYFYSFDDCVSCREQSNVLTKLRIGSDGGLLVFPLNLDLAGDVAFSVILKDYFNVSELPSLVIDREVYSGFVSEEEVKRIICGSGKDVGVCG